MVAVRDLLSYLVLVLAFAAAIPALLGLRAATWSLSLAVADAGPFSAETQLSATKFLVESEPAVGWLCLAAILATNFTLIRIWNAVANL